MTYRANLSDKERDLNTTGTSLGLATIWIGLQLNEWLRLLAMKPDLHWSKAAKIAVASTASVGNSLLATLERLAYGRKIQQLELEYPPIFLLGHWRSGTTLLHNLMCNDPQYTFTSLYTALFPAHFLLTERVISRFLKQLVPKTRPMDDMSLELDQPQEDEIPLLLMTLLSPYLALALPEKRDLFVRYYTLSEVSKEERESWREAMLLLVKKLTLRESKTVLLKSPPHTFRIELLQQIFGQPKFIYIYRNPYSVYRSSLHMRTVMYKENSLGIPDLSNIEEQFFTSYMDMFDTYEKDKLLVPSGNLSEVRFEDLVANPIDELKRIYSELSLTGFDILEPRLQEQMANHKRYRKNKHVLGDDVKAKVYDRIKPAFDRYGYPK